MIVVDTNVVVNFIMEGRFTSDAVRAYQRDANWVAPLLWRSEFRNALALHMRYRQLRLEAAVETGIRAELTIRESFHVSTARVLELAMNSGRTAYDCEFVALAEVLGVPLVTADRALAKSFPETCVALEDFGR